MEGLHQAEYSFPTPDEFIDNAPKPREIDTVLNEMVEKAGEWWLNQLFGAINEELNFANIYSQWEFMNYKTTSNIKDYVSWNDASYSITRDINFINAWGTEIGKTSININFLPSSILMSFSSSIQGYKTLPYTTIEIYNIGDIQTVLESELLLVPEDEV